MKANAKYLIFLGSFLLLAGCSHQEAGQGPESFGNSVRQNIAAEVINPDAAENERTLTYDGERAELAQKHYVLGTGEKAKAPKTSAVGESGSGGGGQ